MDYIMVDIEADGPIPGDYSMVSIGAVRISEKTIKDTFYRELQPISDNYNSEALKVCGFSRDQTLKFEPAGKVMSDFSEWLTGNNSKLRFISDNNGFDWMFICWYLIHFTGGNPLGYTSMNLGSLYKGLKKDLTDNFKSLRKTFHSHNALDDAIGNAEAFIEILNANNFKME